jgi:outer membrane murein-binding lipoprotein Lpp
MNELFVNDKKLFDDNAAQIAQLWGEIAEIDSEIAPLTSRRDAIREQIKELVTALGGSVSVPGFGTALMTKSAKSASYDAQTVDAIVSQLVRDGEIHTAQKLADARKETTRAGYIMLKKDK